MARSCEGIYAALPYLAPDSQIQNPLLYQTELGARVKFRFDLECSATRLASQR